jgi:FMN-dependent oxidoreductase (nitrilotriacetate monooxygenase family)
VADAAPARFHLGWFLNFVTDDWDGRWGAGGRDMTGDFYVEMAKDLERACFDYVLLEDKLMVSDAWGGTMEKDLAHGVTPKHDPVPLAVCMAQATTRLGVIPTMSTSFYPPFLLARLTATVDHIARGRFGWNIVTSAEDRSAQNFGMDKLYEHDERYAMANEYVEVVKALWESWDADAVVRDRERGVYVDHTKVRTIDFDGRYYRSRGPLNTVRPPQGHPVLCQAGSSPPGRAFASRFADTIVASASTPERMKAFRDDIRERLVEQGRKPDECKVLFLISPILGDTVEEAQAKKLRWMSDPLYVELVLTTMGSITEIDFSVFDLDAPLPPVTTNGERGFLEAFAKRAEGKTLRQAVIDDGLGGANDFVGTPATVADKMAAFMDEVGGDGFLITSPEKHLNRRYVTEVTDGLVPELQRRGLVRTAYTHEMLRDNLLEF